MNKCKTMLMLGVAAFTMQMFTGCRTVPDAHRFVLEDGTAVVCDVGLSKPSRDATERFKRLYVALHDKHLDDNADPMTLVVKMMCVEDPQGWLSLAKMLGGVDLDDPVVQEAVGNMYMFGLGLEWDMDKSIVWHKKAAEKDRAWSQCALGWLYGNNYRPPYDKVEAVRWFRRASEHGLAGAQYHLAKAYAEGAGGLPVDREQAFRLSLKAAEGGNAEAQYFVGKAYEDGVGVAKDAAVAVKWYEKSSRGGFVNASEALAHIYEDGRDRVPKDPVKAARWRKDFKIRDAAM